MNPFYERKKLPILDPKKVPAGWEADVFGLVFPPADYTAVSRVEWTDSFALDRNGMRLPTESEQALLDKWGVEWRDDDGDLALLMPSSPL